MTRPIRNQARQRARASLPKAPTIPEETASAVIAAAPADDGHASENLVEPGGKTEAASVSGDTASVADGDSPARFDGLGNPPPRYPLLARQRKVEGRVVMHVLVNARGGVETVSIARSSGSRLLDDAAVDAVKRWRFIPARKAGFAVASAVEVPVLFRLTS
jgi:protein TonB